MAMLRCHDGGGGGGGRQVRSEFTEVQAMIKQLRSPARPPASSSSVQASPSRSVNDIAKVRRTAGQRAAVACRAGGDGVGTR